MSSVFPTRRPPEPVLETAGERGTLVDRAIATGIDAAICYVVFVVPAVFVPAILSVPLLEALNLVALFLSLVVLLPFHMTYAFAFEWQYSRTPGKVARGLLVATADGKPCTFRGSAIRNLLRYVDVLPGPYLVGLASALLSTRGQRVGDRAAQTVVVRAAVGDDATTV